MDFYKKGKFLFSQLSNIYGETNGPPRMKLTILSLLITLFTSTIFAQNPDWVKSIGGDDTDGVNAIAVDSAGNIYVTGSFKETVDFDPSSAVSNLTSTGYSDVFLAKYDSIGAFVWAKKMGGFYWDYGTAICLDDLGNILITGAYRNTVILIRDLEQPIYIPMVGMEYLLANMIMMVITSGLME